MNRVTCALHGRAQFFQMDGLAVARGDAVMNQNAHKPDLAAPTW